MDIDRGTVLIKLGTYYVFSVKPVFYITRDCRLHSSTYLDHKLLHFAQKPTLLILSKMTEKVAIIGSGR